MHRARLPRTLGALLAFLSVLHPSKADAQEIVVGPFLQSATPTDIWVVWETDSGDESRVDWGVGEALDQTSTGGFHEGYDGSRIHEVHLTGLAPETRYAYRVATGGAGSETWHFVTPAEASAEGSFVLVAMSDMQRSSSNPDKYAEVVQDGVIDYVTAHYGPDPAEEIGLVLTAGDLVQDGWDYPQWEEDFFAPGAELMAQVPFYPVIGNHEGDAPYYFRYFHLPENGTEGFLEHWWAADRGNVRIIGLDSNLAYWTEAQTAWLDEVLAEACGDPDIDFVFAQLHHPAHSELWLAGETIFTARIIEQLEQFTEDCGKPSLHFFGHTHGYSRGASPEHRHLMVDVAVAGGSIDYWGDFPQEDYPEYAVTTDDWGFVVVEVQAGPEPEFRLRRVSRGDGDAPLGNVVTDEVVVRLHDAPPETPVPIGPLADGVLADCFALEASPFSDPDGDAHGASQWQIASDCDQFSLARYDSWRQDRNLYFEVDRQEGDDLTDEQVVRLGEEQSFCWRVRYRDDGLAWSDWSEPMRFSTGAFVRTANLLANPGAEEGTSDWVATDGTLESVHILDCESPAAHGGIRSLSLGGGCAGEPGGAALQEVDVSPFASEVDAGGRYAHLSGWFLAPDGLDETTVHLAFLDAGGVVLGVSEPIGAAAAEWTEVVGETEVPAGTRRIDAILERTGGGGGSFVDDLSLALGPAGPLPCAADWPLPEEEDEGGCKGCAAAPGTGRTGFALALAMLLALLARGRARQGAESG